MDAIEVVAIYPKELPQLQEKFPDKVRIVKNATILPVKETETDVFEADAEVLKYLKKIEGISPRTHVVLNWKLNVWESGGGMTNTGEARIVASPDGSPLKPLFVATRGHLACGEHALFSAYKVVLLDFLQDSYATSIEIKELAISDNNCYDEGVACLWEKAAWKGKIGSLDDIPTFLERFIPAIRAGMEKVSCYHCKEPHFVKG